MAMLPALGLVLWGALWIALAFLGVALFALMSPSLGIAGAAAVTALIFLIVVGIGAAVIAISVQRRVDATKKKLLVAGVATSGVSKAAFGLVSKHPLLALGIGGAVAAFVMSRMSSSPPK